MFIGCKMIFIQSPTLSWAWAWPLINVQVCVAIIYWFWTDQLFIIHTARVHVLSKYYINSGPSSLFIKQKKYYNYTHRATLGLVPWMLVLFPLGVLCPLTLAPSLSSAAASWITLLFGVTQLIKELNPSELFENASRVSRNCCDSDPRCVWDERGR